MSLTKEQIAQRIARELSDGYYVNLGIGIPTLVANYIPSGITVVLQSENGLLDCLVCLESTRLLFFIISNNGIVNYKIRYLLLIGEALHLLLLVDESHKGIAFWCAVYGSDNDARSLI